MTNQVAQKKQMPAFLALTIICLVAALALAGTNAITKGPIQELAMAAQRAAFGAVMTADEYVEMTIPEGSGISALVEAKTNGETVGYCVAASAGGYASPVAVTLGIGTDGVVTGAKIGDTSFAETSGFGSRWLAENQTEQFVGIDLKEGGAIEALTGATVTSTAVLNASNTAMSAVCDILNIERTEPVLAFGVAEKKPVEQMTLTGDIHEGSAKGFASDVKVQLTMDASGAITGLAIESSGETPSFGTRVMEDPTFAQQFVGKTAPFAIGGNIDALAGATVTSTAVVNAVNAAVEAPANPDAVPFGSGDAEEPAVEVSAEPLPEGAKTASAKGLLSDVKVSITLNEDGTIATMSVDASGETEAIAKPCTEEAFLSNFIGKKGPFENVDVVSGATFTSTAVINAVNSLFPAEAPAEEAAETLTASAKGLLSDVKVTITLNEDGTIATMTVDASGETEAIAKPCTEEAFLNNFIGKKGPFEGVEVVSGATFTSTAVTNAVSSLFPAEAPAEEAAETLTASAKGLLSDVKVSITLNADGTIATMTVDASGETEAIAKPCTEEAFLSNFIGKKGPFEGVEVVSGATFTSNAVINAVNSLFPAEAPAEEAAETLTASAKGLLSDVKVSITLNEDGTIATMVVDASGETEAIAKPCTEEAFLSNFIGKKGPFEGVEVVSGATFTSNAVINAVNSLFPAVEEAPAIEEAPAANVMEVVMPAFGGESITVTVTLNEDGTIAALTVDAASQTPGLGQKCAEDEFLSQFIGQAGPFALENIDVVSYATITSEAVVNAINSVYPTQDMSIAGEEAAAAAPLAVTVPAFGGESITVTVTLSEDGTIAELTVDAASQTPGLGQKCAEDEFLSQFIGQAGPFALENIDVVSYATITSEAVVNAVNELLAK